MREAAGRVGAGGGGKPSPPVSDVSLVAARITRETGGLGQVMIKGIYQSPLSTAATCAAFRDGNQRVSGVGTLSL